MVWILLLGWLGAAGAADRDPTVVRGELRAELQAIESLLDDADSAAVRAELHRKVDRANALLGELERQSVGTAQPTPLSGPGGTVPLPVNAAGSPEAWQVEWVLRSRGAGTFVLTAERGGEVIETYRRTIPVAPLPDEGSRLACNTAELGRLGGKGSGFYLPEEQAGELATRLATLVQPASRTDTRSVVSGSPWFLAAVLIAALAELAFRRRLNLV